MFSYILPMTIMMMTQSEISQLWELDSVQFTLKFIFDMF